MADNNQIHIKPSDKRLTTEGISYLWSRVKDLVRTLPSTVLHDDTMTGNGSEETPLSILPFASGCTVGLSGSGAVSVTEDPKTGTINYPLDTLTYSAPLIIPSSDPDADLPEETWINMGLRSAGWVFYQLDTSSSVSYLSFTLSSEYSSYEQLWFEHAVQGIPSNASTDSDTSDDTDSNDEPIIQIVDLANKSVGDTLAEFYPYAGEGTEPMVATLKMHAINGNQIILSCSASYAYSLIASKMYKDDTTVVEISECSSVASMPNAETSMDFEVQYIWSIIKSALELTGSAYGGMVIDSISNHRDVYIKNTNPDYKFTDADSINVGLFIADEETEIESSEDIAKFAHFVDLTQYNPGDIIVSGVSISSEMPASYKLVSFTDDKICIRYEVDDDALCTDFILFITPSLNVSYELDYVGKKYTIDIKEPISTQLPLTNYEEKEYGTMPMVTRYVDSSMYLVNPEVYTIREINMIGGIEAALITPYLRSDTKMIGGAKVSFCIFNFLSSINLEQCTTLKYIHYVMGVTSSSFTFEPHEVNLMDYSDGDFIYQSDDYSIKLYSISGNIVILQTIVHDTENSDSISWIHVEPHIPYDEPRKVTKIALESFGAKVYGDCTLVSGYNNSASSFSGVFGLNNFVRSQYSLAAGEGNITHHTHQVVFGKYNARPDDSYSTDYVELVGYGSSDSNRANIRTLDEHGNEMIAGDLKFNGTTSLKNEFLKTIYQFETSEGIQSSVITDSPKYYYYDPSTGEKKSLSARYDNPSSDTVFEVQSKHPLSSYSTFYMTLNYPSVYIDLKTAAVGKTYRGNYLVKYTYYTSYVTITEIGTNYAKFTVSSSSSYPLPYLGYGSSSNTVDNTRTLKLVNVPIVRTAISSAPVNKGDIAIVDGNAYIAVGTSSADDWKKITLS